MSNFAITGPPLPAGVLYRQARERALRELQTRDNQYDQYDQATDCYWCASGLYSVPADGCPGCGSEAYVPRNGVALEVRSALRCGICGGPYKDCWHGCEHKATLPRCFPSAPACSILSPGRGGIKRDHPLRLAAGALPAEGTHKLRP